MDGTMWSRMAMLSGRRIPTRRGSLLSCLRDFLPLDERQRRHATIVVPGCVQLEGGRSHRSLSGQALAALAGTLPAAPGRR